MELIFLMCMQPSQAAALRREVGELRARHLSLGAAVQKRQTEARREVVNLKQERDDVVAKCQVWSRWTFAFILHVYIHHMGLGAV